MSPIIADCAAGILVYFHIEANRNNPICFDQMGMGQGMLSFSLKPKPV
jgi:hypothetical protein